MQADVAPQNLAAPPEARPVGVRTVLRYLIGGRDATDAIAASRRALWIGLLFVLSAGLAREYDQHYLIREPAYLLIPLLASLIASFALFLLIRLAVGRQSAPPGFWRAYRSFLTLFWMTAPLAWLYAIPFERFLSAYDAMRANLWTLGLVAAWRVALMTRVVSVFAHLHAAASFFVVMFFANVAAVAGISFSPVSLPAAMSGVHYSESETLLALVTFFIASLSVITVPIFGLGALAAALRRTPERGWPAFAAANSAPVQPTLRALAVAALLVWLTVLPFTQPEQRLRWRVESLFSAGDIHAALAEVSAYPRSAFPPYWQPLGRYGFARHGPDLFTAVDALADTPTADWVRGVYLQRLRECARDWHFWYFGNDDIPRLAQVLARLPEGPGIAREIREELEERLSYADEEPGRYRAALEAILALADSQVTTPP